MTTLMSTGRWRIFPVYFTTMVYVGNMWTSTNFVCPLSVISSRTIYVSVLAYILPYTFLVPLFCAQQIPYIPVYCSQVKTKILLVYNGTLTLKNKPFCIILEYLAKAVELIDYFFHKVQLFWRSIKYVTALASD